MKKSFTLYLIFLGALLSGVTPLVAAPKVCISIADHNIINKQVTICEGTTIGITSRDCSSSPTAPQNLLYSWTNLDAPTRPAIQTATLSTSEAARYQIRITNKITNEFDLDTITVRYYTKTAFSINNEQEVLIACAGQAEVLRATPGMRSYSWYWQDYGGSKVQVAGTSSELSIFATSSTFGFYSAMGIDANGCTVEDDIFVLGAASPTLNLGADRIICSGENTTLQGPAGDFEYFWSTGDRTRNITVSNAGAYWLRIKSPDFDCFGIDTVVVSAYPGPGLSLAADTTICAGTSIRLNAILRNNDSPPYTFAWSPTGTLSNSQIADPVATPTVSTTYQVVVTDGRGCRETASIRVNINSPLYAQLSATNISVCGRKQTPVSVNVQGGTPFPAPAQSYRYQWSPAAFVSDPSSRSPILSPEETTTYTVTVTDAVGCSTTGAVTVQVERFKIRIEQGAQATFCGDSTLALSTVLEGGQAPFTYSWNQAAPNISSRTIANPVATPTQFGVTIYAVTVTDSRGCQATDTIQIEKYQVPALALSANNDTICENEETTLTVSIQGQGAEQYRLQWTPDPTLDVSVPNAPRVVGLSHGSRLYQAVLINAQGCVSNRATVRVVVLSAPKVNIGSKDTIGIEGIPMVLHANKASNNQGHRFTWTNGQGQVLGNDLTLEVNEPGLYIVEAQNPGTGCSGIDSIYVTFKKEPILFVPKFFSPVSNNADNMTLRVLGEHISPAGFQFTVFNRQGELVYQTNNFADANQRGWNGNHPRTGKPQPMGSYSYIVKGTFADGTTFERAGAASLIR
jgi:hypothetical protein